MGKLPGEINPSEYIPLELNPYAIRLGVRYSGSMIIALWLWLELQTIKVGIRVFPECFFYVKAYFLEVFLGCSQPS